jgi:hypothetical protein
MLVKMGRYDLSKFSLAKKINLKIGKLSHSKFSELWKLTKYLQQSEKHLFKKTV